MFSESAKKSVLGKKGIIFFKNLYENGDGSGGHIDLWNQTGENANFPQKNF